MVISSRLALVGMTLLIWRPASAQKADSAQPRKETAETPVISQLPRPLPQLELSTRDWKFGTVWQGETLEQVVVLKNVGDAPLKLLDVKTSCSCTVAKPEIDLFAPGQEAPITLKVDTLKRYGDLEAFVTIRSNDPKRPNRTIRIRGHIKKIVDIKPISTVGFGRHTALHKETREIDIFHLSDFKSKFELAQGSEKFDVRFEQVKAGRHYRLYVSTKPPMPSGYIRDTVIIKTGIEQYPQIKIPLTIFVPPRVSVSPRRLTVSSGLARSIEQRIRLSYTVERPVRITDILVVGTDRIEINRAPSPPRRKGDFADHYVRVRMPPGKDLPDKGVEIVIKTDDPEFPEFHIPVHKVAYRRPAARLGPAQSPQRRIYIPPKKEESP